MAGHSSCEATGFLIITFSWDFALYSRNKQTSAEMRKNSELKVGHQGALLSIYTEK